MELDKERNVLSKRDTGLSASYRNTFIAEILILLFHPNNWFKGLKKICYLAKKLKDLPLRILFISIKIKKSNIN